MNKTSINTFESFLIILAMLELFTGGGGDIYSFSIFSVRITLRMILFGSFIINFTVINFRRRIQFDNLTIVIIILNIYCLFSLFTGMIFNSSISSFNDYRSVMFLLLYLPIVSLYKNKYSSFQVLYRMLIFSSLVVSFSSIVIYYLINIGLLNVYEFRVILDNFASDTWLRNSGAFIYPSHTFVLITSIVILSKMIFYRINTFEKLCYVVLAIPIFLSNTRGLIITYGVISIFLISYGIMKRKVRLNVIFGLIFILIFIFIFTKDIDFTRFLGFSDQIGGRRVTFLSEGLTAFSRNLLSVIFGNGYGLRLPSTGTLDLEISFFEILVEQGLIGLILWIGYLSYTIIHIHHLTKAAQIERYIGISAISSLVAIVMLSLTNPYINNSLGIMYTFILLMVIKGEYYEKYK